MKKNILTFILNLEKCYHFQLILAHTEDYIMDNWKEIIEEERKWEERNFYKSCLNEDRVESFEIEEKYFIIHFKSGVVLELPINFKDWKNEYDFKKTIKNDY